MRLPFVALLVLTHSCCHVTTVDAQFTCTLSARDEDSCLSNTDDDGSSCVWCNLSGFGFCVNEAAAEMAEQSLPGITCDRKKDSSDDDDANAKPVAPSPPSAQPPTHPQKPTHHNRPSSKPKPPKTDDEIKPNDDKNNVPDNFWNCLGNKNEATCKEKGGGSCTWCKSKAGYGLCMSGPAAKSAQKSHFFQCDKEQEEAEEPEFVVAEVKKNNNKEDEFKTIFDDTTCLTAYLQNPTEQGCISALDQQGYACEFCSLGKGIVHVCLNQDQAEQAAASSIPLGIVCQEVPPPPPPLHLSLQADDDVDEEDENEPNLLLQEEIVLDPMDPSCVMAYLKEPSQDACLAAVDADGTACEWCSFQGFNLCLTSEQAEMGQQAVGMTCDSSHNNIQDIKKKQQQEEEEQQLSQDDEEEGSMSRYYGKLYGASYTSAEEEDEEVARRVASKDNMDDPSCITAYLQDPTEQGCTSAQDREGTACEFCSLAGIVNVCLNHDQAEQGAAALGITCQEHPNELVFVQEEVILDPMDPSCMLAYLKEPTNPDACTAAVDADGTACEWCSFQGFNLCLTSEQAEMGQQAVGMTCSSSSTSSSSFSSSIKKGIPSGDTSFGDDVKLPDDFWKCLQNYQSDSCQDDCTWCKTSVGIGVCFSNAVADAMKECTFFDCAYHEDNHDDEPEGPFRKSPREGVDKLASSSSMDYMDYDFMDSTCLYAVLANPQDAQHVCEATLDQAGESCMWCNWDKTQFGLCLASAQANRATEASPRVQCTSDNYYVAIK